MSAKLGRRVTSYVPGRNDAFLFGMRLAYIAAAGVCLVGVLVTGIRMYGRRRQEGGDSPFRSRPRIRCRSKLRMHSPGRLTGIHRREGRAALKPGRFFAPRGTGKASGIPR